jgi:hypothetical protein
MKRTVFSMVGSSLSILIMYSGLAHGVKYYMSLFYIVLAKARQNSLRMILDKALLTHSVHDVNRYALFPEL